MPATLGGPAYLIGDPEGLRETKRAIADTGVRPLDVEIVWLRPETELETFAPLFDVAVEIGARAVQVIGSDAERSRLVDRFASLCQTAAPLGLTLNLEPMIFSEVKDLLTAQEVVSSAAQPNGGVLVDTLHFYRGGGRPEQIDDLPSKFMNYMQLCDAPAEPPKTMDEMIAFARGERLMPGEGALDLVSVLCRMPPDLPVSLEIPNVTSSLRDDERARVALQAARRVLAEAAACSSLSAIAPSPDASNSGSASGAS